MRNVLHAEWTKLWRPGLVLGGLGSMAAVTCILTAVVFARASPAPAAQGQPLSDLSPNLGALAMGGGLVAGFTVANSFLGLIALVLFAQVTGSEYREGTLKVLLSHEPRRVHLLLGKLGALAAFVALGIVAAFMLEIGTAAALAASRGVPTDAWWTTDALQNAAGLLARMVGSVVVRGLMGACLAVVFSAAVPAIGVALGYTFVGDGLIVAAWKDSRMWLPHQALAAFAKGGTPDIALGDAAMVVAAYAVVFLVVALGLFRSRDVTT